MQSEIRVLFNHAHHLKIYMDMVCRLLVYIVSASTPSDILSE